MTSEKIALLYHGERFANGTTTVTAGGRELDPAPSQKLWNHSPDGFNWGVDEESLGGVGEVRFDVAIGAEHPEPLRVGGDLLNRGAGLALDVPLVLFRSVGVMEVQSRRTPVVAATLALAPKHDSQSLPLCSLLCPEPSLAAFATHLGVTLPPGGSQNYPAGFATAIPLQLHRGAFVLAAGGEVLTAPRAAVFLTETWVTQRALPVASIRNALVARRAEHGRVWFHDHSPFGVCASLRALTHRANVGCDRGSGPAQLALAILLDVTGDPEVALSNYQRFKEQWVANWDGPTWTVSRAEVLDWLEAGQTRHDG